LTDIEILTDQTQRVASCGYIAIILG